MSIQDPAVAHFRLWDAWLDLGRILLATPDGVTAIVRNILYSSAPCGFRRRFKVDTLLNPAIFSNNSSSGGAAEDGGDTLLFGGVDLTRLSEAACDDWRYIMARHVRSRALLKSRVARLELKDAHMYMQDIGMPDAHRVAYAGEVSRCKYTALDAVASTDLELECLLQWIAPCMTLPFAPDLIVPEILLFVFSALRLEPPGGTIAEHAREIAPHDWEHKLRLVVFGADQWHLRILLPAFLEVPLADTFNLTTTAVASVPPSEALAGAGMPCHAPVFYALTRIKELDPSLSQSFAEVVVNDVDKRFDIPQARYTCNQFRYGDAFYRSYDGWFLVLTYLLELATGIHGTLLDSSTPTDTLETEYKILVKWFEGALSAVLFARANDANRLPALLRRGAIILSPGAMAEHVDAWRGCVEPHELLTAWDEYGCVVVRQDLPVDSNHITEGLKSIQDWAGRANPLDGFSRVLSEARGPLKLEEPLLDAAATQHWNDTHARLFRRGRETWRRICEGLRAVAARYATTHVVQKWVDPPLDTNVM